MRYAFLLIIVFPFFVHAQSWVDTVYSIQVISNIPYGTVVDFAGNQRTLTLDVAVPDNDTPPPCGRPLMMIIHGGAWLGGSKDEANIQRYLKDFAKRGYVTAAINYRLGMFQTHQNVHCNVPDWDCLNMADTSEWYRGLYRGVQDANGAVRYMVDHAAQYNIDPRNVFLMGESAGAFISIAVAYTDDTSEITYNTGALDTVQPPNAIYESQCIQGYGLDTSISSMQLARPDLGHFSGTLNPTTVPYEIKGVGSFFGGLFQDLFSVHSTLPALYMFHQPNDLIVPYTRNGVLAGYAACAANTGGCSYVINRPKVWGSKGIADLLDTLDAHGTTIPDYLFEHTSNNADCLMQIANPSTGGHQLDNLWLRTTNLATFLAPKIDTTSTCINGIATASNGGMTIFPNPAGDRLWIRGVPNIDRIQLYDLHGRSVLVANHDPEGLLVLPESLPNGMYFLMVEAAHKRYTQMVIIHR